MGDIKGFLKVKRKAAEYRPVCVRVKDYCEVNLSRTDEHAKEQASRCMDCGTAFCHWGCPIGNYIPEWNDLMFKGDWKKAFDILTATNNLPEITARICPAICEYACVLGINDDSVTVRENELNIIEHAFSKGLIKPRLPLKRKKHKVAVIGSGPSGLACADQLNKSGYQITVFEKDDKIGGILRYGIPDFKLSKEILDRRIKILKKEGIKFLTKVNVGVDIKISALRKEFDCICLAGGSREPRDLKIEGRDLGGIYFAMDYLIQSNRRVAGEIIPPDALIDAKGKSVIVIGGGDTGADCVGVANRQGAGCVTQIELMPKPPECRLDNMPWPKYPMLLKVSTSHAEGANRQWSILTKKFIGENGRVKKLSCVKAGFSGKDSQGCLIMKEVPGTNFEIEADLVVLALGFLYPEKKGLLSGLKELKYDVRGSVQTDDKYNTSVKGVFACGDMHRGQSLVVWAIYEGRQAARGIEEYLDKPSVFSHRLSAKEKE